MAPSKSICLVEMPFFRALLIRMLSPALWAILTQIIWDSKDKRFSVNIGKHEYFLQSMLLMKLFLFFHHFLIYWFKSGMAKILHQLGMMPAFFSFMTNATHNDTLSFS